MTAATRQKTPDSPDYPVEIRVLGGVTVRLAGQRVHLGDAKHRLMLAMLVAAEGRLIPTEQLIDQIWDDHPPRTARDLVHSYASYLRRYLEAGRVGAAAMLPRHHDGGYQLLVSRENVDLCRFRDLRARARPLAGHDDAQAAALLRQALSQWGAAGTGAGPGGGPLADMNGTPAADSRWLEAYRHTLREEHRATLIACLEAELRLGEHERLTAELADLASADPPDERIAGMLLIAYYRSGRQGEVTLAYQSTRKRLLTELGVEPGQDLRDLYQRIIGHDPRLDLPAASDNPGTTTGGTHGETAGEVPQATERERDLIQPVAVSGLLSRPFLRLAGTPSPATALRPAYGVVPFDDSAGQLRRLANWADTAASHSVVALLGPPGSGKTRLAVELCRTMSRQGWTTGALTRSAVVDPSALATVLAWKARRLLVVDYAEDRPDQVRDLLTRLHGSGSSTHPIRVVMTVRRSFGLGWRSAFRGSDADDILDTAEELDIVDAWQYIDRGRFFTTAQAAFESCLKLPGRRRALPPNWAYDPALSTPLLLAASALTDLLTGGDHAFPAHRDADEVVAGLLAHEANYWVSAPAAHDGPDGRTVTARALVATALGERAEETNEVDTAARLAYCSDLRDEPAAKRRKWARWLLSHYPSGRLEPDLFLEHLVVEQCAAARSDDPIDWAAALSPERAVADVAATLTLIARVAQRSPSFAASIIDSWARALPPLVELARTRANESGPLLSSLAAAAEALPVNPDIEKAALDLPGDPRFADLGAALLQKAVTALRERGVDDDRLFEALIGAGVYRGLQSEHAEAAAAALAAVEWLRQSPHVRGTKRRADLARTLSNLGADLAEGGEFAAAVAATEEAVGLYRRALDEKQPSSKRVLAFALHNLGGALTLAGDHIRALEATSECVALIRAIATAERDLEQLSVGLTNLALCHLRLGQDCAAVPPANEGVKLLRPLARKSPADRDSQMLKALSTLSAVSARTGAKELALNSQREALTLARRLYAADPERWTDELARHLRNLARRLAAHGLRDEEKRIRSEVAELGVSKNAAVPGTTEQSEPRWRRVGP